MNWNVWEFWIDGGCRGDHASGNREACGSISDGKSVERYQFAKARTNNEAEYMALSELLGNLLSKRVYAPNPPTIFTDSQLIFGQLTQGSKVRAKNLLALHNEAALLLRRTGAKLIWVPRDQIVKQLGH